jgi:hypothetical protein
MQNPSVGMPAQPGMNPNMQGQPGMNPNPNPAPNNPGIALDKSDDEYVADYIGNNANKLMTKKFNFAAFFLGSGYYFFRKHFIFGLIYILSYYLVPFVMDKMGMQVTAMSGCILVINIVLAILFNKSYVSKARKSVSKIKAANAGSDSFTLSSILRKKGGTNVLLFFLGFIVLGLPAALGVESPLISVNIGGNAINKGETVDTTDDSGSEFIPSDGVIVYDDVDLATNVNITIPTGFEEGFMHSDTSYVYEYSFNEDGTKCDGFNCNKCEIDLKTVKGFKTAKDLLVNKLVLIQLL